MDKRKKLEGDGEPEANRPDTLRPRPSEGTEELEDERTIATDDDEMDDDDEDLDELEDDDEDLEAVDDDEDIDDAAGGPRRTIT